MEFFNVVESSRAVIEFNDPMEGVKKIDTFTDCTVFKAEDRIVVTDETTVTSYESNNVIRYKCTKKEA